MIYKNKKIVIIIHIQGVSLAAAENVGFRKNNTVRNKTKQLHDIPMYV